MVVEEPDLHDCPILWPCYCAFFRIFISADMDAAAEWKNEQLPSRIRPPSRTCSGESRSERGSSLHSHFQIGNPASLLGRKPHARKQKENDQ